MRPASLEAIENALGHNLAPNAKRLLEGAIALYRIIYMASSTNASAADTRATLHAIARLPDENAANAALAECDAHSASLIEYALLTRKADTIRFAARAMGSQATSARGRKGRALPLLVVMIGRMWVACGGAPSARASYNTRTGATSPLLRFGVAVYGEVTAQHTDPADIAKAIRKHARRMG